MFCFEILNEFLSPGMVNQQSNWMTKTHYFQIYLLISAYDFMNTIFIKIYISKPYIIWQTGLFLLKRTQEALDGCLGIKHLRNSMLAYVILNSFNILTAWEDLSLTLFLPSCMSWDKSLDLSETHSLFLTCVSSYLSQRLSLDGIMHYKVLVKFTLFDIWTKDMAFKI